mgnify:CR=1 FL=1
MESNTEQAVIAVYERWFKRPWILRFFEWSFAYKKREAQTYLFAATFIQWIVAFKFYITGRDYLCMITWLSLLMVWWFVMGLAHHLHTGWMLKKMLKDYKDRTGDEIQAANFKHYLKLFGIE